MKVLKGTPAMRASLGDRHWSFRLWGTDLIWLPFSLLKDTHHPHTFCIIYSVLPPWSCFWWWVLSDFCVELDALILVPCSESPHAIDGWPRADCHLNSSLVHGYLGGSRSRHWLHLGTRWLHLVEAVIRSINHQQHCESFMVRVKNMHTHNDLSQATMGLY